MNMKQRITAMVCSAAMLLTAVQSARYAMPVLTASAAATETAAGWFESAYLTWKPVSGASGYNFYADGAQQDSMLIRQYNGYYRVRRGKTWYLADENGDLVDGIYGKEIYYFPYGYVTLQRSSGSWDIYHCSGRKVECYSNESPYMFWNGCFLIKQGRYWYAVDANGDKIDGVYGDTVTLLDNGRWKCVRGNYVSYID